MAVAVEDVVDAVEPAEVVEGLAFVSLACHEKEVLSVVLESEKYSYCVGYHGESSFTLPLF